MSSLRTSVLLLLMTVVPVIVQAASEAPPAGDFEVVRQGQSVVSGIFTGEKSTRLWEYNDQFDDAGNPVTLTQVVTTYQFQVDEVIDGDQLGGTILLHVVGGELDGIVTPQTVVVPSTEERVVLSLSLDAGAEVRGLETGYNITHNVVYDAEDALQLAKLRQIVLDMREPEAEHPQEAVEFDRLTQEGLEEFETNEELQCQLPDQPTGTETNETTQKEISDESTMLIKDEADREAGATGETQLLRGLTGEASRTRLNNTLALQGTVLAGDY